MKSAKKPNAILVLDLLTGGWVLWENFPVAEFTKTSLNGRNILVFHDNTTAKSYEMFKGKTDNGTNISLRVYTKAYPADGQAGTLEGAFQETELTAEATEDATFTVKGRIDSGLQQTEPGDYVTLVNESNVNMDLEGSQLDLSSGDDLPFNFRDGHLIQEKFNIVNKIDPNTGRHIEYLIEEATDAEVSINRILTRSLPNVYTLQEGVG